MNRNVTNAIRHVMDEYLPAVIRDSKWFMYPFYVVAYRGHDVRTAMRFKSLVYSWTDEQYSTFYGNLNTISRNRATDLNPPSLRHVLGALDQDATSLLDVGCGGGYLLREIARARPDLVVHGVDVIEPSGEHRFDFTRAHMHRLPFEDRSFDIVVSSHTIEHLVHLDAGIAELKRVARKQLIVVTPCQRPFYYTLDEHLNFFPYREKLTSALAVGDHECRKVRGDWVFVGRLDATPQGGSPK